MLHIIHTGTASLQTPPPVHHSRGASTVKREHVQEEGVCSGVARGPACQVMDI